MSDKNYIIQLKEAVARLPEFRFENPVSWELKKNEHWAVIGRNGAGKSVFTDLISGKINLQSGTRSFGEDKQQNRIKTLSFRNVYDTVDYKIKYYQQRWNSTEADQAPLVSELIQNWENQDYLFELLRFFHAEDLLNKQIILLSSGELRKFLIIKALLENPTVLILDNPYIGIDKKSRLLLDELMKEMVLLGNLQIILVVSNPIDIPPFITHILPVCNMRLGAVVSSGAFMTNQALQDQLFPTEKLEAEFPLVKQNECTYNYAVRMESVNIRYGNRTILKDLNWNVKRGEKWALLGENGAGKSTLLSLIYGDNPQAYANTFYLFDRKRGTGESIWDIKRQIGYVSPELHLFYLKNVPVFQIVVSGFFDSIGLFGKCTADQEQIALNWMRIFGVENLKERSFLKISYGEQRLALLARTFVKSPDLLILDEPLHGLDKSNKARAKQIIEQYCESPYKTLIYVTHYQAEIPNCVDNQFVLTKQN